MTWIHLISLLVVAALFAYLVVALFMPEKFS
ncbi:MAG: K(+)-transporting ATPase subunit F [Magnetococcales bacterium]|nr:K(+)-transporting ATPase subunit F [Magnetococcales bacterium]